MTLQEAILTVLKRNNEPMKPRDIALEINKYSLYKQKDDSTVSSNQVWARVNQYKNLFRITDDKKIAELSEETQQQEAFFRWVRNFVVHSSTHDYDIILPYIVYFIRRVNKPESPYPQKAISKELLLKTIEDGSLNFLPKDFFEELSHILDRIERTLLESILKQFDQFIDLITKTTDENFTKLFQRLIIQVASKGIKYFEFGTPQSLSNLIFELFQIKQGQSVYDPFAGSCLLLSHIVKNRKDIDVYANEINKRVSLGGILNLMVSYKKEFTFSNLNAFEDNNSRRYDWIVSNPPFSKDNHYERNHIRLNDKFPDNAIGLVYRKLKTNGKAILIVPDSFLFSGDKNFLLTRNLLLNDNAINAVISLPNGLFKPYSNLSANIIIIEKGKANNDIYFADYSALSTSEFEYRINELSNQIKGKIEIQGKSAIVPIETILRESSLNLSPKKNILNKYGDDDYVKKGVRLRDLIKSKISGKTVPLSNLNEEQDGVPYLRISDLSANPEYPSLASAPQKYISDFELLQSDLKMVESGDIALAKIGNSIKQTIYKFNEPAIASPNILSFRLDNTKIIAEFFVKELNEDYVKKQLESIHIKAAGPSFFREKDLLDLKIIIPSLKEQKERVEKEDTGIYQRGRQDISNISSDRISLREQIKHMMDLSKTLSTQADSLTKALSTQADNLTKALSNNVKQHSDWVEETLESILEYAGLQKDIQYFVQQKVQNHDGAIIRPDIIVKYPDGRSLVIDSWVSLVHYNRYCAAVTKEEQTLHLGQLINSLKHHIDDLSRKDYRAVTDELDFIMMFIPNEAAYITALQVEHELWQYAYKKRVLLISPTNLIPAMKLVADMWQKDAIERNALEIADKAGKLYDNLTKSLSKNEKPIREKQIISSIKHRIAQYVSPVSNDIQNLQHYFETKSEEKSTVSTNDQISKRKKSIMVLDVFNRININLNGIAETFDLMNNILYFNKEDIKLSKVNIKQIILNALESVEERMEGIEFPILVDERLSEEDLIIQIDKKQIEELFRNFYINSIKHGFDDSIPPKIIFIYINKDPDNNFLEINLINNGKPFPDDFTLEDFISFGKKGNNSEGTGIGGYLMKKIIDNHEGKLEWFGDMNMRFEDQKNESKEWIAVINFKVSLPYIIN